VADPVHVKQPQQSRVLGQQLRRQAVPPVAELDDDLGGG
jgi:hypothetical protein